MTITISVFSIDLYDSVFSLWRQCEGIGLSSADEKRSIAFYLDRNPGMSFIAMADSKIVGAILSGHDGRRGYIHHLAVHPDFRRQDIGRRLVYECLQAMRRNGIQKCHIFIFNDNADGIAFWQSIGWVRRADIGVISKLIENP